MQGARRRPYVDMVEEGNAAADRPGRNPEGRGNLRAFLCREPSQYRHIASDSPPRTASHTCLVMKQVLDSSGQCRTKPVGRKVCAGRIRQRMRLVPTSITAWPPAMNADFSGSWLKSAGGISSSRMRTG